VINFRDWPLARAEEFPDCFAIVTAKVKPERERNRDRRRREVWWQFTRPTLDLYAAIDGMERVIAVPRVTKSLAFAFVPTGYVYADRLVIIAYDDYGRFGVLASQLHACWVLSHSATLETRPTYNPTDCFETFPQPQLSEELAGIAQALDEHRRALMLARNDGLTRTYNCLHDADETAADIAELRRLHVELDHAVGAAYGWDDLDLDHGFHETPQGVRYTIGPVARVEVLDRLLELNHERYAAEVAAGLHAKKKVAKRKRNRVAVSDQTTLDGMS
jgi:hypothetical protein